MRKAMMLWFGMLGVVLCQVSPLLERVPLARDLA